MLIKLDNGAVLPTGAHESDAGYDLYTPCAFTLQGGSTALIDTGVHFLIPEGYAGIIMPKSGLNVKHGILTDGLIDSGYTGSVRVKLYSMTEDNVFNDKHFDKGDKIAQIVFVPVFTPELEPVQELPETERGENGFGSSGR